MNQKFGYIDTPGSISVIGGGRWARVIIETLIELLPEAVTLNIHSVHNSLNMISWAAEKGFSHRVNIKNFLPEDNSSRSVVIVVNAATDHAAAAAHCISQGASVLIEKPICTSFEDVKNLKELAHQHSVFVAPAHVFMFADYIQFFIKRVRESGHIKQISCIWTDPKSESRYGEQKSYDSSLPILADLLPHLISITSGLFRDVNPVFSNIKLTKGGQDVRMELRYDSVPCTIAMARNGSARKRIIEVITYSGSFQIDFASDPAIFKCTTDNIDYMEEIVNAERPLRRMLNMFIAGCFSESLDGRFDIELGLQISQIIDQAIIRYREEQKFWIYDNLSEGIKDDMIYALTEIFQVKEILYKDQLDKYLNEFHTWASNINRQGQKIHISDISLKLERISSNKSLKLTNHKLY